MSVDSKNKFWKEFFIWLGMNIIVAGFLCIGILLLKDHFSGQKGWFYVINKVAYSGYFYAWSITLLAGSLSNLFRRLALGERSKGDVLLTAISVLLLIFVVASYVSYNAQVADIDAEKIVKNLDLKELAGEDLYAKYDTKEMNADTFIARIWETKSAEDVLNSNSIDKEQLAETLLEVKVKIEDPRFHWNSFYIVLTFLSFFVALCTFFCTSYPKPKDDSKEGAE